MKRIFAALIIVLIVGQSCGSKQTGTNLAHSRLKAGSLFNPIGVDAKDYDFASVTLILKILFTRIHPKIKFWTP